MDDRASACELCGAACLGGERHPREVIEHERIDFAAEIEAVAETSRGRQPWFSSRRRRDPAVLASTPRYRYVRRTYRLCPDCDARIGAEQAQAAQGQRRGAATVAWSVLALAAALLALGWLWPGAYVALGLEHGGPFQPYVKTEVPPSATPYRPPFDPSTPAEGAAGNTQ